MDQPPDKPDRNYRNPFERRCGELLDEVVGHAAWEYHFDVPNTAKTVDAYMKNVGVLLEFDGDYYHIDPDRLEDIENPDDLDAKQVHQFYNDLRREELFYDEGYSLVRIWERNVNERPDEVKRKIRAIEHSDWLPGGRYLIGWPHRDE